MGTTTTKRRRRQPDDHAPARPEKTERTCLGCGSAFLSWGPGNRICERCKANNAALSPLALARGNGSSIAGRKRP